MSTTIDLTNATGETAPGLGCEIKIRVGETVAEMRAGFDGFAKQIPDLTIEQDHSGEILNMALAGAEGSSRNSEIAFQLTGWARYWQRIGDTAFDGAGRRRLNRWHRCLMPVSWHQHRSVGARAI